MVTYLVTHDKLNVRNQVNLAHVDDSNSQSVKLFEIDFQRPLYDCGEVFFNATPLALLQLRYEMPPAILATLLFVLETHTNQTSA